MVARQEVHELIHGKAKAKGAHAAHASMGHRHDANAKLADAFTAEMADAARPARLTVKFPAKLALSSSPPGSRWCMAGPARQRVGRIARAEVKRTIGALLGVEPALRQDGPDGT